MTARVRSSLRPSGVAIAAGIVGAALAGCSPAVTCAPPSGIVGDTLAPVTRCGADPEVALIEGRFEVSLTADDFLAGGVDDEDLIAENSGTFVFDFLDGHWRYEQTGEETENPTGQGRYTIEDGVLRFLWTAYPDDFTMASVEVGDDGALVFTDIVDSYPDYQAFAEVFFGAHPWTPVR